MAIGGIVAAETFAWVKRRRQHCEQYNLALERSLTMQRPVLIFGDRSSCAMGQSLGFRFSVVIPVVGGTVCEADAPRDLAEIPDDTVVVLVEGVFEYAKDPDAILAELRRVAGDHLFLGAPLQAWTLAANALARRTGSVSDARPVSTAQRVGVAGLLATVAIGALRDT